MLRRHCFAALTALAMLVAALPADAQDTFMIYTETAAFVSWIEVVPDVELTPENTPRQFTAVVRKAGKLKGFGLPVHIADRVDIRLVAPYTYRVTHGQESVDIDTYKKIHFSHYPRF